MYPSSITLALHRQGDLRIDPTELAQRWGDPSSRLIVLDGKGALRSGFDEPIRGAFTPTEHVFLGVAEGRSWFAVEDEGDGAVSSVPRPSLREGDLDHWQEEVLTAATAVLAWHRREPRCERCNGQTDPIDGGFVRLCRDCGAQLFPRTDPAMIVVLLDPGTSVDEERLLLAHAGGWPDRRMSLLAGFVEAGESLEACVVREVDEESGLQVTAVGYVGSQAWPFPRSLMLGCIATARPGEPVVDGVELDEARWFTRASMDAAIDTGELVLSAPGSIARRMIEAWRSGELTAERACVPVTTGANR